MRTVLCIAAEGDISQMPCVLNVTNRYSAAVFVAALVSECFVFCIRSEKTKILRPLDLLKKKLECCFIA
jgi:hypothetical protein